MMQVDLYTKFVLTVIALLLGVLAIKPVVQPATVAAQPATRDLYVEPGVTTIRKPDGNSLGDGKVVWNMRTGEVWGFPTNVVNARYPVDVASHKPAVSNPTLLGQFDLAAIK